MRRMPPALAVLAIPMLILAACAQTASAPAAAEETASHAAESHAMDSPEAEESEAASPSEEAAGEEVRVRLESSNFDPNELTIPAGTTVLFLNADSFAHTVTEGTNGQAVEDPIVDRDIAQNRTVRVTFEEPGTYDITCRIHPSMQMTITVES